MWLRVRRLQTLIAFPNSKRARHLMRSITTDYVRRFADIQLRDVPLVGGKNASLGEMFRNLTSQGVKVPDGFAVTAAAYRHFLAANDLEQVLSAELGDLDTRNLEQLRQRGQRVRQAILSAQIPDDLR